MKVALSQIIRKGQRRSQLVIAFTGSVIGLFILIGAIQLYLDYTSIMFGGKDLLKDGFMIEKKVTAANTLTQQKASFSQEELDDIKALEFVEDLAPVKNSNFKVELSGGKLFRDLLGGADFRLLFFFQSIPDRFLDNQAKNFKWAEGDSTIPIIVPSDYLNLFNSGFASSQGVAQLSEDLLETLVVNVRVAGNGNDDTYYGQIVGFNPTINSILVPDSFMTYAGDRYAEQPEESFTRLFVVAHAKYHHKFVDLIEKEGYVVDQRKLELSEEKAKVQIILSILLFIGGIILIQAALNFILYSQLSIYRNEYEIGVLTNIGYDYKTISKTYIIHFATIFIAIFITAFLLAILGKGFLNQWAQERHFELKGLLDPITYLIGILFLVVYVFVNSYSISKSIKEIARRN